MSYSYLLDNNSNVKFNVKNSLTMSDTTSTNVQKITATNSDKHIIHTVDDLGYHVRNGLTNQKLLSVNHSNTLNDCVVKREINTTVAPINTTIATHETRISNIRSNKYIIFRNRRYIRKWKQCTKSINNRFG